MPGEETLAAAQRRLLEEMGFNTELEMAFSFIYRTDFDNGLTEHEVDHVFTGLYDGIVTPNPSEVHNYSFQPVNTIRRSIQYEPHLYPSWFNIAFPKLESYLAVAGK
jgi:isopentenyl-diphosphate delta-isomerase